MPDLTSVAGIAATPTAGGSIGHIAFQSPNVSIDAPSVAISIGALGMPLAGALAGFAVFSATRLITTSQDDSDHRGKYRTVGLAPVLVSSLITVLVLVMNSLFMAIASLEDLPAASKMAPYTIAVIWGGIILAVTPMVRIAIVETRYHSRSHRSVAEWRNKWWFPNILPITLAALLALLVIQSAAVIFWNGEWISWFSTFFIFPLFFSGAISAAILYTCGLGRLRNYHYNRSGSMLLVMDADGRILLEKQTSGSWEGKYTLPRHEDIGDVAGDSRPAADKAFGKLTNQLAAKTKLEADVIKSEMGLAVGNKILYGRKTRLLEYFRDIGKDAMPKSTVFEAPMLNGVREDYKTYRANAHCRALDGVKNLKESKDTDLMCWVEADEETSLDSRIPLHVRDLIAGIRRAETGKPEFWFWEIGEPLHVVKCKHWRPANSVQRIAGWIADH